MRFDEKNVDEIIGKNGPGIEGGGELAPFEIEILHALIDAVEAEHYVDWVAFTRKHGT